MQKIIFIGGIHGVGKTSVCNDLTNTYQIPSYSASKIISDLKKQRFSSNKLIPDIDANQVLLIEGLQRIETDSKWILLDGHFCLINENHTVTRVPKAVFEQIRPNAFIVVTDKVSDIALRLEKRDNVDYELSFLEKFQNEELNYAEFLAGKLNIPIFIYSRDTDLYPHVHEFITKLEVLP